MRISQHKGFQYISLIMLYILAIINYFHPVIRFDSRLLNNALMILVLLIPVGLMIQGFFFKSVVGKTLNTLIWIIPCLVGILISIMIVPFSARAFEPIKSINLDHSDIVAYRTNGGATTSFGIQVRQEKDIFPGIKLVKTVYSQYRKDNVDMIKTGENSFKIEGNQKTVKRNVYFE